jgi:hypothetical protein
MVLNSMTLFELRGPAAAWGESLETGSPELTLDDVISCSGDDLGFELDGSGYLVLTEGSDFG